MTFTPSRWLGLALLAVAAGAMWLSLRLDVPFAADPVGPKAFPAIVAAVLALCGLGLLFQRGAPWLSAERRAPGPVVVAAMLAYAPLLVPLGFLLATALLAGVIALAFGARPVQAAILGGVMAPTLWLLLDKVLDLPLPPGVLGL